MTNANLVIDLQKIALELLKTSGLADELKQQWQSMMPYLPEERVAVMVDKLKEEQKIKQGEIKLTPEQATKVQDQLKAVKKEAWQKAEEENANKNPPENILARLND